MYIQTINGKVNSLFKMYFYNIIWKYTLNIFIDILILVFKIL